MAVQLIIVLNSLTLLSSLFFSLISIFASKCTVCLALSSRINTLLFPSIPDIKDCISGNVDPCEVAHLVLRCLSKLIIVHGTIRINELNYQMKQNICLAIYF